MGTRTYAGHSFKKEKQNGIKYPHGACTPHRRQYDTRLAVPGALQQTPGKDFHKPILIGIGDRNINLAEYDPVALNGRHTIQIDYERTVHPDKAGIGQGVFHRLHTHQRHDRAIIRMNAHIIFDSFQIEHGIQMDLDDFVVGFYEDTPFLDGNIRLDRASFQFELALCFLGRRQEVA